MFRDVRDKKTYPKFEPGDPVETTKEYTQILSTLRPFRGIVVDYPEKPDDAIKVREASGHERFISPYWLRLIPFDRFYCCNNMCECECHHQKKEKSKEGEIVEVIEVRPIYKPKISIMDIRLSRIIPNLKPKQKIRIIIEK